MTSNPNIYIAVDMMSGDFGLKVTIPAVFMALANHANLSLILVGDSLEITKGLSAYNSNYATQFPNRIKIHHSDQVVAMDDLPVAALRRKPNSSMRVSLNLVKSKEAKACVSAGNTGALMVIAKYVLRTLPGVDRPAILYPIPAKDKAVSVLDLGANIDCSPQQLFQFAVMGSVLVSALENKDRPTIGLLNIGAEENKGTDIIKSAGKLIAECRDLNYYGFVEGNDIYKATVDVVVCDGFIGNVTLKVSEGLAKLILHYVNQGFMANWWTKFIALLAKPILQSIFNKINPGKYNGASLLGLNGVVVKSHGGADAVAFSAAITAGFLAARKNIPLLIKEKVELYLKDYQKV